MGYFNPLPEKNKFVDVFLKLVVDVIVVIVIAVFFIHFFCAKEQVIGSSMSPVLDNEEVVLINKMKYKLTDPDRYDVIVYENEFGTSIKRIIGLPGEKIKIENNVIYINGEPIEDKYFKENFESGYVSEEQEIGPDEYFVMGDNRNVSEDSRFSYVGNIRYSDIIGKAWFIATPFNQMGFVD